VSAPTQLFNLRRTNTYYQQTSQLGAATSILDKPYLTDAGSILTIEARHSSYLWAALNESRFPAPFDTPLDFLHRLLPTLQRAFARESFPRAHTRHKGHHQIRRHDPLTDARIRALAAAGLTRALYLRRVYHGHGPDLRYSDDGAAGCGWQTYVVLTACQFFND
jgi:hypothetical protein